MVRLAVVGAGLSGLACANRFLELAAERRLSADVVVFEAERRAGGVVRTERVGSFLLEAGPDSFLSEKPWARDLATRLGLEGEILGTREEERRTFVLSSGRLHPLPEGFVLLAPTRPGPVLRSSLFSWRGKLRLGLELLLPRGSEARDESVADFVLRRFGREALERVADPLVAGIYGTDAERLSLRATLPRFFELERKYRSVTLGILRERKRIAGVGPGASGARWSLFLSFREGMRTLVDALVARMPEGALHLGERVLSATPSGSRWRLETDRGTVVETDGVVLAVPAFAAARILEPVDATLARELAGVPYGGVATVHLALPEGEIGAELSGFGFVVARSDRKRVAACSYVHRKYPGRAPEGYALLRAFVCGSELPEEDRLVGEVRDELARILRIRSEPTLARAFRHPRALPHYPPGYPATLERIQRSVRRHRGLALAGNAYGGVGVPDCIRSGETAAERVLSDLS